jgi:ribose transport system permease protein
MNGKANAVKKIISTPEFSSAIILLVMVIITASFQENFFEQKSLVRTINAFLPLILMAMGQAVVIISGGIDLSAGTALSLMTVILTTIMKKEAPLTGVYALVITYIVAILIGMINGLGMGYLRLPPVIVTYATSYIWLGIALFIRPTPGGTTTEWFRMFYDFNAVSNMPPFIINLGKFLPPALILVLIGCIGWFIFNKTRMGRYIYAVGSNNDSAYASGINTAWTQTVACIVNASFIFLTAIFFAAQNQSGDARMGDPLTLRAIAAAIVGGVALTGGRGNVYFALVGALILSFVSKIIFFANIPNAYQTLVSGVIVIGAIAASLAYTLYSKRSIVKIGRQ